MFRKTIMTLAGILVIGVAQATGLSALEVPTQIPATARPVTIGQAFSLDGSVLGTAQSTTFGPTCGRGCIPVQYNQVYNVAWDLEGNVMTAVLCGTRRYHLPQATTWVYEPGFDASSCHYTATLATGTTVQVDGVNYYYVTADSAAEILRDQNRSYAYSF